MMLDIPAFRRYKAGMAEKVRIEVRLTPDLARKLRAIQKHTSEAAAVVLRRLIIEEFKRR